MNHVVVFLFAPRGATNHYELLKYVKDFSMILNQFPEILNQYGAYQASVKMITALFEAFEKETQIINQDVEFTKRKLHNEAKQESILKILPYSKEAVTETAAKGALIEFKHVTIATPLVDPETPRRVLFEDLHFSLPPRKNLLIMGPSGTA